MAAALHIFGSHVALLLLRAATAGSCGATVVVVVVVVMRLEDFLAQLLLPLVDICIQFISVLTDREFLIVIDRNINFARANWLVLGVVELGHISVSQGLFRREPSVWVELKEVTEEVQGIIRGCWEHVSQPSWLCLG